jgi:predicted ferric reductase
LTLSICLQNRNLLKRVILLILKIWLKLNSSFLSFKLNIIITLIRSLENINILRIIIIMMMMEYLSKIVAFRMYLPILLIENWFITCSNITTYHKWLSLISYFFTNCRIILSILILTIKAKLTSIKWEKFMPIINLSYLWQQQKRIIIYNIYIFLVFIILY